MPLLFLTNTMNSATKVIVALVVVLVIAGVAYYMLSGSSSMMPEGTAMNGDIPAATDSVDDFATAMQEELSASAAAIKAFDTSVDTSVADVQTSAAAATSYDPNNL